QGWRVIAGTVLGCRSDYLRTDGCQRAAGWGESRRDGDPVDKIAPRNRPAHAETAQSFGAASGAGHRLPRSGYQVSYTDMRYQRVTVTPAKTGVQGSGRSSVGLDPRLRGNDE